MDDYRTHQSPEEQRELGITPVYEKKHSPKCKYAEGGRPCREFSTDGTLLGAHIAHTMGSTSEEAITRFAIEQSKRDAEKRLTGMEEEQADWEEDE